MEVFSLLSPPLDFSMPLSIERKLLEPKAKPRQNIFSMEPCLAAGWSPLDFS